MKVVCKRFLDSGMTPEQVAKRMNVPMKFINACMRKGYFLTKERVKYELLYKGNARGRI